MKKGISVVLLLLAVCIPISSDAAILAQGRGKAPTAKSQVSYPECTILTRTMWLGAVDARNGGEVSRLQSFLKKQGNYSGAITGKFNRATDEALYSWQNSHGIKPDIADGWIHYRTVLSQDVIDKIREVSCDSKPHHDDDDTPSKKPSRTKVDLPTFNHPASVRPSPSGSYFPEPLPRVTSVHGRLPKGCVVLTQEFWRGATDKSTQGEVSRIQKYLENIYGIVDGEYDRRGVFGPATEAMVLAFQKDYEITPAPYGKYETMINDETINMLRRLTCDTQNDAGYSTCKAISNKEGEYVRSDCKGHQKYAPENPRCLRNKTCIDGDDLSNPHKGSMLSPDGGETIKTESLVHVSWTLNKRGEVRIMLVSEEFGVRFPVISGYMGAGEDVGWVVNPNFAPGPYHLELDVDERTLDKTGTFNIVSARY